MHPWFAYKTQAETSLANIACMIIKVKYELLELLARVVFASNSSLKKLLFPCLKVIAEDVGTQAPVYDAAILTLKVPIKFKWEPHVRPVCFPSLHEFRENGTGTVAGWGHIKYEGTHGGRLFAIH